jgi:hypothetical protein
MPIRVHTKLYGTITQKQAEPTHTYLSIYMELGGKFFLQCNVYLIPEYAARRVWCFFKMTH